MFRTSVVFYKCAKKCKIWVDRQSGAQTQEGDDDDVYELKVTTDVCKEDVIEDEMWNADKPVDNECIPSFASSVTLDGLRVIILSIIEITDFLLHKPDLFPYVLTGKIN